MRPETTSTPSPEIATETTESTSAPARADTSIPGVKPTLPDTIPPNALLCHQTPTGSGTVTSAQVGDRRPADLALALSGPDGMSGQVTIASTPLDAGAAFAAYGDAAVDRSAVSVLNVMPAEFCGFSSQRLFGNWSDKPGESVEFADRITHIWTNTGDYLVAIHVEGPAGASSSPGYSPGFHEAKDVLMCLTPQRGSSLTPHRSSDLP